MNVAWPRACSYEPVFIVSEISCGSIYSAYTLRYHRCVYCGVRMEQLIVAPTPALSHGPGWLALAANPDWKLRFSKSIVAASGK